MYNKIPWQLLPATPMEISSCLYAVLGRSVGGYRSTVHGWDKVRKAEASAKKKAGGDALSLAMASRVEFETDASNSLCLTRCVYRADDFHFIGSGFCHHHCDENIDIDNKSQFVLCRVAAEVG